MIAHGHPAYGQPEASAGPVVSSGVGGELLEDFVQMPQGDPGAGIVDVYPVGVRSVDRFDASIEGRIQTRRLSDSAVPEKRVPFDIDKTLSA